METDKMAVMVGPLSIRGVSQSICMSSAALQNKAKAAKIVAALMPNTSRFRFRKSRILQKHIHEEHNIITLKFRRTSSNVARQKYLQCLQA
jgi:hypothetical protein